MPQAFFFVALFGLVVVLNAIRPVPGMVLSVPSFFAAWLTAELAPHWLALHVVGITLFIVFGGLHGGLGWAALGICVAIAAGFVLLITESERARPVLEEALTEALGPGYMNMIDPPKRARYDLRAPWRELLLPFHMTHPDVERTKNLAYGPVKRRNLIDVYRHKDHPTGCPVFIYVHGGAWTPTSHKDHQGRPLMLHLASRGWVCFAPNYRLSPPAVFPDHLVDVKKAIAWVHEHAAEFGGDPSFIAIGGGSAGGHLSALAALTQNDPEYQPGFESADTSIDAAIPIYGVYDFSNESGTRAIQGRILFLERVVMKARFSKDRQAFEKASPYMRIRSDAPPFFVIHGQHDSLVPVAEGRFFALKLREISDSPVAYAELPGAQHAFDVFPSIRTGHQIRAIERFLDYLLGMQARGRRGDKPVQQAH